MYCPTCTAKFYLPKQFLIKNKKNPTRVCIDCRDKCLEIKRAINKSNTNTPKETKRMLSSSHNNGSNSTEGCGILRIGQTIYPPLDWEDPNYYLDCRICHKKTSKSHNCRICGFLFCSKCTSKLEIPDIFLSRKKKKTGPARVCNTCHYVVVDGAILSKMPYPKDNNDLSLKITDENNQQQQQQHPVKMSFQQQFVAKLQSGGLMKNKQQQQTDSSLFNRTKNQIHNNIPPSSDKENTDNFHSSADSVVHLKIVFEKK